MLIDIYHFLLNAVTANPIEIIKAGGYVGMALIVFLESGVIFGVFLPGDSLLFVAGILASEGFFSLSTLISIVVIAAILGDAVGYWFGAAVGESLLTRGDSRFFKKKYLERTQVFFHKYGAQSLILARFVPVARTLAPILAGVGEMHYGRFILYNALGAVIWGAGLLTLGYSLGKVVPEGSTYILVLVGLITMLSFIPLGWKFVRSKLNEPRTM